jgi:hypothetical protein
MELFRPLCPMLAYRSNCALSFLRLQHFLNVFGAHSCLTVHCAVRIELYHSQRTRDSSNSTLKGPTQPPVQWVAGLQRPERGVDYPPPLSSAEAEEE